MQNTEAAPAARASDYSIGFVMARGRDAVFVSAASEFAIIARTWTGARAKNAFMHQSDSSVQLFERGRDAMLVSVVSRNDKADCDQDE